MPVTYQVQHGLLNSWRRGERCVPLRGVPVNLGHDDFFVDATVPAWCEQLEWEVTYTGHNSNLSAIIRQVQALP